MKSVNKTQMGAIVMLLGIGTLMGVLLFKSCSSEKIKAGKKVFIPLTFEQKLQKEKLVEL
jgi:hypothetical protein